MSSATRRSTNSGTAFVLIVVLFGLCPGASAQLSPEIMADAYLLQMEQAIRDGDLDRGRTAIRKIGALQNQHELGLDAEFYFRYARAADSLGMSDVASESVVKYLAMAGREGQHYAEAIALMKKAMAKTTRGDVLAQLSPNIIADAKLWDAEQSIQEGDLDRARTALQDIRALQEQHELDLPDGFHFRYAKAANSVEMHEQALKSVMKYLAVSGREGRHYVEALELMNRAQIAVNCRGWDTEEYFKTATVEEVRACLETGIDAKAKDESGMTPLHRAVRYSENGDVIAALLNAGADKEARDNNKRTPLHWAVQYANAVAVKALVDADASPDVQDEVMQTALIIATKEIVIPEVFVSLLNAGANTEATDNKERTPLHWAAVSNNRVAIRTMVEAGANLEATDENEDTPLSIAVEYGHPEAIRVLVEAGADRARAREKWTALHWAVSYNEDPGAISRLLESQVNINARDSDNWRPLHVAARYNSNPDVVLALLDAGANVEAKASDKKRPLHVAAAYNVNPAVVEVLLKAGADIKAKSKKKHTPLHAASYNVNPAVVEVLLKAGADIEAKASDKKRPLHVAAAYNGNPAVVEVLLKAGADIKAKSKKKHAPLHVAAAQNQNPAVVEVLLKAGADIEAKASDKKRPLHVAAAYNGNPAVVEVLLKAGADINAEGKDKHTPLHSAAEINRNPDAVRFLLEAGANVNARTKYGDTPLHRAANFNDNPAVLKEMLDAGADVERRGNFGMTPLHSAAGFNTNTAIVEILLDAGADPNAKIETSWLDSWNKWTPLDIAVSINENPVVARILRNAGAVTRKEQGANWGKVAVGVVGAAAIAHAGKDAPTEVTEQAMADWINVMTGGEPSTNAPTDSGSEPTQSEGGHSQGATAQDEMQQALQKLERACGEKYQSGIAPNDHVRFYCLAAFNDYCALKSTQNDESRRQLRARLAQNCEVLEGFGAAGKCPYCQ